MPLRPAMTALSLLSLATAAGAAMVFLTQTLLARRYGPDDYGLFASSLATVTVIAPLAGFGLSQYRLKVFGAEGWAAQRWRVASERFITLTTALTLAVLVAWALWGPPVDARTREFLLVLSPVVLGLLAVEQIGSKLRLEDRHAALAGWQLLVPGGRLLVALLATAWLAMPLISVAWAYAVLALLVLAMAAPQWIAMARGRWSLHGHGASLQSSDAPKPGIRELAWQAWPYGMAAVLYPVFFQIGTVLLKYLAGDAAAGHFGIALAVMTAIYLFPATVYQKFLIAKLHRWAVHDRARFDQVYRWGAMAMLASGLIVAALLYVAAPWATLVFGQAYDGLESLLRLLAICVPLRFLSTAVGSVLLTERHMRYRVAAMALAALAAVLLNLALIPALAETGAAWATVGAEALLLALMAYGARRVRKGELR
ncbi:lipopolysaccharide biosynthesis protein [Pseudoxanthomonas indica]|nr:polysaccharide biosynthesis C-terminal domain-containing protein [Pseudoxanthomonas indica]